MKDKIILIAGPEEISCRGAYGGGVGGYTRNFQVYLRTIRLCGAQFKPLYHTVRNQEGRFKGNLFIRLIRDTGRFIWACLCHKPVAVHVLAQYRGALPREYVISKLCLLFGVSFIYDVKAGAFEASYQNGPPYYRWMQRSVIKSSEAIFVEGEKCCRFLTKTFGREVIFFPNFVPDTEVPENANSLFVTTAIQVLFVGYCYKDKGIIELVQGARFVVESGLPLRLRIIGEEHPEFTAWIDSLAPIDGLDVYREGRQPHEKVLQAMQSSDIYAYPTFHSGEGHNNSINEAMMHGLVILTTRQGFLEDVLRGCAFFLNEVNPVEIARELIRINADRDAAKGVARMARNRLISEYTSVAANARVQRVYEKILAGNYCPNIEF